MNLRDNFDSLEGCPPQGLGRHRRNVVEGLGEAAAGELSTRLQRAAQGRRRRESAKPRGGTQGEGGKAPMHDATLKPAQAPR